MEGPSYKEDAWMEKIDGKIVMMSPRPFVKHNIITTNISRIFGNFLVGKPCVVFADVRGHIARTDNCKGF